ncbi:IS630 family transposase [Persicitalea sp.]|uniref:IS630 family transposase n=1 Tax=Persicitalea sp. TaxID=3100273 RepID=UPI003593D7EF
MKNNDARKMDREALAELRIRAVSQIRKGESPEQIAKVLGVNRVTVYRWMTRFANGGYNGLKRKKAPGKSRLLTETQMRSLYYMLVDTTPEQMKLPFALWTLAGVKECVRRRFGLKLSKATMGRLMARLGLSFQKPVQRAYEQSGNLVKTWLKKEFPQIQKQAKREGAEIYFEDESGIRSDAAVGKTWGRIGKTPVVKRTGRRYSLNLVSAISPRGELRFMFTKGSFGAKEFVEFLNRLMKTTPRKVFIITDGHPAHKSKLVKKFLEENIERIKLFFLPPYSPELNPDELVWNALKGNISRSLIKDQDDLEGNVMGYMRSLQKRPERVRAFFQERHVRYVLQT